MIKMITITIITMITKMIKTDIANTNLLATKMMMANGESEKKRQFDFYATTRYQEECVKIRVNSILRSRKCLPFPHTDSYISTYIYKPIFFW